MKIGLVCPYIYPDGGGVAQHVGYLYENLRLRGHDVRIITASHGPQRASEGDVIRVGVGFSVPTNGSVGTLTFSPRYISQIRTMLRQEQFDLLHFHEPFVPFLSIFLLRESTSVNVATFHAYAGFSPSYEFGGRFLGGYARRLHGRIAVSAAARHFIDRFFPGDYKVIPNGVDIDRYRRAVPIARWQDGTRNLLFVGRHEPRKGVGVLLDAFEGLERDAVLWVTGDGPETEALRGRNVPNVEWIGRVSDDEKARRLRAATVFCAPALGGESFGIVLLEAMAASAAVVASDIDGFRNVARADRDAILVDPGDAGALRGAMQRLLDDPSRRAELVASGEQRAAEFSMRQLAERFVTLYEAAIERSTVTR
jgi:phosphatidylinositol alpha-mannosyltransferase